MADIYGSHFEYANITSRQYGLIIANVETSRFNQISGLISGTEVYSKSENKRYLIDNDYSGFPLSFDMEIVTSDGGVIPFNKRREIEKWLFNKHNYRKLYFDINDDYNEETYEIIDGVEKRLYMNCRFINPIKLEYNGGVVGYRTTLEADSGLLWQDPIVKTFEIGNKLSDSTSTINIAVDTDLDDYTYPKVTVKLGEHGGDFIMVNNSDDSTRLTKFTDIPPYTTIIINGQINFVSEQYYQKFNTRNFPRLVDGENGVTINGNVIEVTFEYNNRRML